MKADGLANLLSHRKGLSEEEKLFKQVDQFLKDTYPATRSPPPERSSQSREAYEDDAFRSAKRSVKGHQGKMHKLSGVPAAVVERIHHHASDFTSLSGASAGNSYTAPSGLIEKSSGPHEQSTLAANSLMQKLDTLTSNHSEENPIVHINENDYLELHQVTPTNISLKNASSMDS